MSNFFKSYSVLFTNREVFLKVGKVSDASQTGKNVATCTSPNHFRLKIIFYCSIRMVFFWYYCACTLYVVINAIQMCHRQRVSVSRNFQPSFRITLIGGMSHSRNIPLLFVLWRLILQIYWKIFFLFFFYISAKVIAQYNLLLIPILLPLFSATSKRI